MKKEPNLIITPAVFPVPLIILPETDSTNNHLTQLCNEQQSAVREFTTVIAERQTAGKGQRGNSWELDGRYFHQMAERHLLERKENLRHTDRK